MHSWMIYAGYEGRGHCGKNITRGIFSLQLMFLPSYSGWFTGERDSINTCILMSMFDRVSEIHVFSENQTMKIIIKNLLIYCHAKMKMK